jgi:undecaprenyl-diphosphatase
VIDALWWLDQSIFIFINSTLSNPIGDILWPYLTDYDKLLPIRIVLIIVWVLLLVRGGARGRTAALMIIPVLFISDQMSSSLIKPLVHRARPCQMVDGIRVMQQLHLIVDCGPGKSFPSSHAVNNFAVATVFSTYYRRYAPWFYGWASMIALSRVAVGVHFPSDVLGGALIGTVCGYSCCVAWRTIQQKVVPSWSVNDDLEAGA